MTGHASQVRAAVTGLESSEIKWPLNAPTTSRRRVDQDEARTDSRWLYLAAWKAGTGQEGIESSAMGLSCFHNREIPYFGELQELQADPVPRPGSWSEPKSTLMTMTREKNYFSTPISRMKESKGVLESPRAGLDDRMSSF